jgi:citrate synthase
LPNTLHPMTQLGIGVAALNHGSSFQAAYEKGMYKSEYWTHTLDDSLVLIARLPALAARIYRNIYHPSKPLVHIDEELDLVGQPTKEQVPMRGTDAATLCQETTHVFSDMATTNT